MKKQTKTQNKQTLNLTPLARELQLVNDYNQAQKPIFKAILNTLDGKQTLYFDNIANLHAYTKHNTNFGLELFYLTRTATKCNLNKLIIEMSMKLAKINQKTAEKRQILSNLKAQKKEIRAQQKLSQDTKRKYIQDIEERIAEAKAEYYHIYNNELRQVRLKLEFLRESASRWNTIRQVRLNTAILKRFA